MSADPWLILASAPGLNGDRLIQAMESLGDPRDLVGASEQQLRACGLTEKTARAITAPDIQAQATAEAWLARPGHRLIGLTNPDYPPLLREIPDPPVALFVAGVSERLKLPQLAVVGSRNASPAGLENAHGFASYLARAGFAITSGLALGIDAAAHRGALDSGGITVAVLGCGPDRIYPRDHEELASQIAEQGILLSEFPPGTPPRKENFPKRNRIISGLSAGTLVVEAGARSGALITARFAGEQGREVFAVPGSIHNPMARGCHALIRQGARLTETAHELVDELGGLLSESIYADASEAETQAVPGRMDLDYDRLLAAMGHDPVGIDVLVNRTGLTTEQVSSMLLRLELQGCVAPTAGGRYQQIQMAGLSG